MRYPRSSILIAAALSTASCGGSGLSANGAIFFRATLNGADWKPTSSTAEQVGSLDSLVLHLAASRIAQQADSTIQDDELGMVLRVPVKRGKYTLGDTASDAQTGFTRTTILGSSQLGIGVYATALFDPGTLTISAVDTADGVVAGTFQYLAYRTVEPHSAPPVRVAGSFRLSYRSE